MKEFSNQQTETGSVQNSPKFHMSEVLAKFRPQFTRNQQAQFMTQGVLYILTDPNWLIRHNYHEQQWHYLFRHISESYCRRFFLMHTGVSEIVVQISKIKFSCLKHLDLSNNKITNLESLSFLKVPHIKRLILKNNNIVNISTLRKNKWRNIQNIDMQGNYLIQWGNINQFYVDPRQVQYFNVQFLNSEVTTNLEDIAKLYAKFIWTVKNDQIEDSMKYFFAEQVNNSQEQASNRVIRLHQNKYHALRRRFKGNQ